MSSCEKTVHRSSVYRQRDQTCPACIYKFHISSAVRALYQTNKSSMATWGAKPPLTDQSPIWKVEFSLYGRLRGFSIVVNSADILQPLIYIYLCHHLHL